MISSIFDKQNNNISDLNTPSSNCTRERIYSFHSHLSTPKNPYEKIDRLVCDQDDLLKKIAIEEMMKGSKIEDSVHLERQEKVLVSNEKQLKRFIKSYKNIDKIK